MDNALSTPETVSGPSREKTGQIKHQLFWCFLLLAGASLCVGIVLMIEPPRGLAWGGAIRGEEASLSSVALPWRIALGIGLIIGIHGLGFLFLVHRIANPLA